MYIVSFTPVVFANGKRADGSYNVKVRVYYKGKDRKLATSLTAYPEDLTKKLAIKSQSLKEKCAGLIKELRKPLETLTFAQLEVMDVDDIIRHIRDAQRGFTLDFFEYADKVIAKRKKATAVVMRSGINAFADFLGKDKLDISLISSVMLRNFQLWMEARKGKSRRSTTAYLNDVRIVINEARMEFNDESNERVKNPFAYFSIPTSAEPEHRSIDASIVRQMVRERETLQGAERFGVDVFLISFFLCGMNLPDLMECNKPEGGIITFQRSKTRDKRSDRAEGKIRIEPEIAPLLAEYADSKRFFDFYRNFDTRYKLNIEVNRGLSLWAERHGYANITYYQARHSMATISHQIGTPKEIINDMLTHVDKNMKMTDIYINKDWSRVWEANRRLVLYILKG